MTNNCSSSINCSSMTSNSSSMTTNNISINNRFPISLPPPAS